MRLSLNKLCRFPKSGPLQDLGFRVEVLLVSIRRMRVFWRLAARTESLQFQGVCGGARSLNTVPTRKYSGSMQGFNL